jgi:hypothetical protein
MSSQKTRVLAHDGLRVVGNAIAYGATRVASFALAVSGPSDITVMRGDWETLKRSEKHTQRQLAAAVVEVAYGSRLKESVERFKADWRAKPLAETHQ